MSNVRRYTWDEDYGGWAAGPDDHFAPNEELVRASDYDRLRAGLQRIADGYGGDVQSLAKNLLEGKA